MREEASSLSNAVQQKKSETKRSRPFILQQAPTCLVKSLFETHSIQCQFETFVVEALLPNSIALCSGLAIHSSCHVYTRRGLTEVVCIPHFISLFFLLVVVVEGVSLLPSDRLFLSQALLRFHWSLSEVATAVSALL